MNLAIFAPQALRNSLLLVSFSVGNWQKNKQLPGSNQTMVPVPSSSLHRGRESFCYWKITLHAYSCLVNVLRNNTLGNWEKQDWVKEVEMWCNCNRGLGWSNREFWSCNDPSVLSPVEAGRLAFVPTPRPAIYLSLDTDSPSPKGLNLGKVSSHRLREIPEDGLICEF